jgi:dihydrofolate reductase
MSISIVAAVTDNDLIGKDGQIPWFVRGDQAIFKRITMGKPIIMGRRTYESPKTYKSKPRLLPGRLNVIITRNPKYQVPEGGVVVHSFEQALELPEVKSAEEVCVIGGQQLFEAALPLAKRVYLTRVHANIDGDTYFHFDPAGWKMTASEKYLKNEVPDRPYDFEFQIWDRQ